MLRLIFCLLFPVVAMADPPRVTDVSLQRTDDMWTVLVTLSHPDTGWDHYADGWRIVDADGNQLGMRTLYHPHVAEQPFTRSLTGVRIPAGLTEIFVQAHCKVDGWSDVLVPVAVP